MNADELTNYLHNHIPLSAAMQVRVAACQEDGVSVAAPLAPNINHRNTAFGGSLASIATLAAWSLLHLRLTQLGIDARLVIKRSSMNYTAPVDAEFTATAAAPAAETWAAFLGMLTRKGKGRIVVSARLESRGSDAGSFEGEFVAVAVETGA